jgi:hypothetical protein
MELLRLDEPLDDLGPDPVLVLALDGWTDAGEGGTAAAATLRGSGPVRQLGAFPSDALYDYRDRRPQLAIDRGLLGEVRWPELVVEVVCPPAGPPLVLVTGGEPDFHWQAIGRDLVELAARAGAGRYVGLGAVPGPLPHTRPVQMICTASDREVLERLGGAHEQVVVPASCQVAMEAMLRDAGLATVGFWARIPHYVAGAYPDAARALLERFSAHLGTPVDLQELDREVAENRTRLDVAASSSDEVREHVRQLEQLYDAEQEAERLATSVGDDPPMTPEQVPSADELAAEIERFLRGRPS